MEWNEFEVRNPGYQEEAKAYYRSHYQGLRCNDIR